MCIIKVTFEVTPSFLIRVYWPVRNVSLYWELEASAQSNHVVENYAEFRITYLSLSVLSKQL